VYNWNEARRLYRLAADKFHVIAIYNLATEAWLGYFRFSYIVQEDDMREPDFEEAFRLYRKGAAG
jgi:TPR repeat protein